jgi:hypothetical protein
MRSSAGTPEIHAQLDAAERDAHLLVEGLDEHHALQRPTAGCWSVAECLDHLAITNHAYLAAMQGPVQRAHDRRGAVLGAGGTQPGRIGAWFVSTLEPPPRMRMKSPRSILPAAATPLADAFAAFVASNNQVRRFLEAYRGLNLTKIRFANPFIPGLRFSVATGIHIIAAHERRHLWQAWQARRAAESGGNGKLA